MWLFWSITVWHWCSNPLTWRFWSYSLMPTKILGCINFGSLWYFESIRNSVFWGGGCAKRHGGSVTECVLYLRCHRIYYNECVREYINLYVFYNTCLIWIFHYLKTNALECIFKDTSSTARWENIKTCWIF